ncbi:hypothetical protein AAHA92_24713 [Salvia divinorum]|uniref:Uncharacterized protein n=1 Tax=Salvia divinorum TaxID=28513 RepID=A0ABD1G896_SALDI
MNDSPQKTELVSGNELRFRRNDSPLGTTKWQLEEFRRAVRSSYSGERDELAMFLSGQSLSSPAKLFGKHPAGPMALGQEISREGDQQVNNDCSRTSSHLVELDQVDGKGDKFSGHWRAASASADIGSWKIVVADDVLK